MFKEKWVCVHVCMDDVHMWFQSYGYGFTAERTILKDKKADLFKFKFTGISEVDNSHPFRTYLKNHKIS